MNLVEWLIAGVVFGIGFFGIAFIFLQLVGNLLSKGLGEYQEEEEETEYMAKELKDNEGYH